MKIVSTVSSFVKKNAPTILTWAGIGLFSGASVYSVFATFKAANDISNAEDECGEFSKKEKVSIVWKRYIPSVVMLAGGITCVLTANHINILRIEALTAAYAVARKDLNKYKEKAKEVFDIKHDSDEERCVDDDLPPWVKPHSDGTIMICEGATGRTFRGTKEAVEAGVNRFNNYLIHNGEATLNDLFDTLGIQECEMGDKLYINNLELGKILVPKWRWVDNPNDPTNPILMFSYPDWDINPFYSKEK